MLFKVGDKVTFRNDLACDNRTTYPMLHNPDQYAFSTPSMKVLRGHTATITYAESNRYRIADDGGAFFYTDTMFDLSGINVKDLPQGVIVETRNGFKGLIYGEKILFKNMYNDSGYANGLQRRTDDISDYDIVKIYKSRASGWANLFTEDNLQCIWELEEEPEAKEMTVEQIEERLGYKIKIISGDKDV